MRKKFNDRFLKLSVILSTLTLSQNISQAHPNDGNEWQIDPSTLAPISLEDIENFQNFDYQDHPPEFFSFDENIHSNDNADGNSNLTLEIKEWAPTSEELDYRDEILHKNSSPLKTQPLKSLTLGESNEPNPNDYISEKYKPGIIVTPTNSLPDLKEIAQAEPPTPNAPAPSPHIPTAEETIRSALPQTEETTPVTPVTPATTPVTPPTENYIRPSAPASSGEPDPTLEQAQSDVATGETAQPKTILINFNNVGMIEYIRFISRVTNKNFLFDENDLQFTVTIISEEPTTIENVMTALLQELRIHDLSLIEEGNNLIIHKNKAVNAISNVVTVDSPIPPNVDIITQVFRLNNLEVGKAATLLRPMLSSSALIEILEDTNYLIITDIAGNMIQVARLLKSLDSPQSGMVIGQYVVRNAFIDTLIDLAQKIIQPIAQNQTLLFVPHDAANSIFIIASPYLVERTMSILQYLDQNQGTTRILNPSELQFPTPGTTKEGLGGTTEGETGAGIGGTEIEKEPTWNLDRFGNWQFELPAGIQTEGPPPGKMDCRSSRKLVFCTGR